MEKINLLGIEIEVGECAPLGYGYAYYDYFRKKKIVYPIPLNLLIKMLRNIYYYCLKVLHNSKYEKEIWKIQNDSYWRGYERGHQKYCQWCGKEL